MNAHRALLLVASLVAAPLSAQEPSQGVRIGLTYAPGTRPGLYVLRLNGPHADSIRAIIARDLDFGDRISVIAPADGVAPSGNLNYPLYARLGAAAVLQLTLNTAGGLHTVLHEVAARRVLNTADFPLRGAPHSAEWRRSLHDVSDEIERWVTGVQGVAATRIAFVRNSTLWMVDSDGQNVASVIGVGLSMS